MLHVLLPDNENPNCYYALSEYTFAGWRTGTGSTASIAGSMFMSNMSSFVSLTEPSHDPRVDGLGWLTWKGGSVVFLPFNAFYELAMQGVFWVQPMV